MALPGQSKVVQSKTEAALFINYRLFEYHMSFQQTCAVIEIMHMLNINRRQIYCCKQR